MDGTSAFGGERLDPLASATHRAEVVEQMLWQMRQEVMAPRMMQAALEGLADAMGADGAMVLDLLSLPDAVTVLHSAGAEPPAGPAALFDMLQTETADPIHAVMDGLEVLACPAYTRHGGRAGLFAWRTITHAAWHEGGARLVSSVTAIVRMVLEHEAIQRELALQARTDPLTGLLNRRSFLEEAARRIDRLDREQLPGTLMYVDLDHFKELNDTCGHEVGDQALVLAATMLRNTVRPADLIARLGGDEFALWMDGSDELTAAERAESLRVAGPAAFADALPEDAPVLSMSIGIAARHPMFADELDEVMRRADLAMYDAKKSGRGCWRVARDAFD